MVSLQNENVMSLVEATKHLPRRRQGKKPNVSTLYRWAMKGCRGVRLETVCIGATRCTSLEALQRFAERVTAVADGQSPAPQPGTSPSHAAADRTLREAGW